ncbi:hypothetical protein AgCh_038539 [Apium graveolens]
MEYISQDLTCLSIHRFEALELEFCNKAVIALSTHLNNCFSILFQICQRKKRRLDKLQMLLLEAQSLMIFTHWTEKKTKVSTVPYGWSATHFSKFSGSLVSLSLKGVGALDLICGSQRSLFQASDVIGRIFTNNASNSHTPLCLLSEHIQGKSYPLTGSVKSEKNKINDAVTWNIILSGFSGSRIHDSEVMRIFFKMHYAEDLKPTSVTIAIILPVCARARSLGTGRSVHSCAIKNGLESDTQERHLNYSTGC